MSCLINPPTLEAKSVKVLPELLPVEVVAVFPPSNPENPPSSELTELPEPVDPYLPLLPPVKPPKRLPSPPALFPPPKRP